MKLVWQIEDDKACSLCKSLDGRECGDGWTNTQGSETSLWGRNGKGEMERVATADPKLYGSPPLHPNCRCRVVVIDDESVAMLSRHIWPGNVRELYHTLERTLLIGDGEITAEVLSGQIGDPDPERRVPLGGFQVAIDHAEKQLLQDALRAADGNKTAAAALGMKPSTFRDKLVKHGLS